MQVPRYAPPPYPEYWQEGVEGTVQGAASQEALSHNPDGFSDIAYMLQVSCAFLCTKFQANAPMPPAI